MSLYESYAELVLSAEAAILHWADPDFKFRGFTEDWPLMNVVTAVNIALAYFVFVVVSTAIMKLGVPAMDPYPIKFLYNVSQIMLCSYMTLEAVFLARRNGHTICSGYNQDEPAFANLVWLFYLSKLWDFWDTIFIILGKKWRQLSFLHVYHHLSVFLLYWLNARVDYDGDVYLSIVLNGGIHTVMYMYYFISMHTKVPETGKSLPIWWKSSLTMMQMIQFVTMMSQGIFLVVTGCEEIPIRLFYIYVGYALSLLLLFAQFYVMAYIKPKTGKKSKTQ